MRLKLTQALEGRKQQVSLCCFNTSEAFFLLEKDKKLIV